MKYRALQIIFVFGLIIVNSIFINSCVKDEIGIGYDNLLNKRNTDVSLSSKQKVLQKFNFDSEGNILLSTANPDLKLKHANIDYQREISDFLLDFKDFHYWDSINLKYGTPIWELTILTESNTPNSYVITVPLVKDGSLTSIITYFTNGERTKAVFIDKKNIDEVLNNENPDVKTINFWRLPFKIFITYDFFISNNANERILNWITNAENLLKNLRQDKLTNRDWCIFMEIIDVYTAYVVSGEIIYIEPEPNYTKYIYTIEFCEGPPPFINPGSSYTGDGIKPHTPTQNCFMMASDFMVNWMARDFLENESLIDPCNPEKTTSDILHQLAINACLKGVDLENLQNIEDILSDKQNGFGGKMHKTESFLQCKALNCLFDAMWEKGISNFCGLQDNFESDNKIIDLKIGKEEDFIGKNEFLRGKVGIDKETGRITLSFNPKLCGISFDIESAYPFADFLSSAKTIIHESIHADFWRQASTLLPDGKTLYPIDGKSWEESVREFLNIICTDGDGITDQHEEMMTFWVDKIAKDLWEFNNKIGTWEDYLYLAWQGIVTDPDKITDPCMLLFITQSELDVYENRYNDNVVNNQQTIDNQKNLNDCINN